MTLMVGSAQHRSNATTTSVMSAVKHHRGEIQRHAPESGSDTSASPVNEFSNTPTYRVPTKSSGSAASQCRSGAGGGGNGGGSSGGGGGIAGSSTESNNDASPVLERRSAAKAAGTPRHLADQRGGIAGARGISGGRSMKVPRDSSHSMDLGRAISNNR